MTDDAIATAIHKYDRQTINTQNWRSYATLQS